jgi:aspartyl protease family protein
LENTLSGNIKALVMLAIIIGLIVVVATHGQAVTGLGQDDLISLVYKVGFLVLVGSVAMRLFRNHFAEAIQSVLLWVIIALVLVAGYSYRNELRDLSDRIMAELIPGRAVARGQTVEIARARGGDFQVNMTVNGARVPMVLDTGASTVMLTRDAAIAAGLPAEMIKYTVSVETANGRTQAAAATIDRISVGNIVERAVPALIAQPGALKMSLLGMSFLSRLQSWEVRGDRLVMRGEGESGR